MFRKALESRLQVIFGFRKTTFEAPSDSFEQDTLFVEISDCKTRVMDARISAKVTGELVTYSRHDSHTYGALMKRLDKAPAQAKRDLFFYNVDRHIENSPASLVDIDERRTAFVFLFSAQHDPSLGAIISLELECANE